MKQFSKCGFRESLCEIMRFWQFEIYLFNIVAILLQKIVFMIMRLNDFCRRNQNTILFLLLTGKAVVVWPQY
jgi:hypothetical protein